jgi:hypothetical protein
MTDCNLSEDIQEIEITFKGNHLLVEFTLEPIDDMYSPHQLVGVDLVSIVKVNSNGGLDEVELDDSELTQIACDIATIFADDIRSATIH